LDDFSFSARRPRASNTFGMSLRFSIIISSAHEPRTIGSAVAAVAKQCDPRATEIIVVAPDIETLNAAKEQQAKYPHLRLLQDQGKGKPAALNLAMDHARGEFLVLTDGDVVVADDAFPYLFEPLRHPSVGAVSGRPVPQNPRSTRFGFWAHFLTDAADHVRKNRIQQLAPIECSGYLMVVQKSLLEKLPEDTFADDPVLTFMVLKKGKTIAYAPEAKVRVKYPTHGRDWVLQKTRSIGGYVQEYVSQHEDRMRSFRREIAGLGFALRYPRSVREVVWMGELFVVRLVVWILAFIRVRIQHKSIAQLWKRVDTTK
jgi:cellulose synthase/poly-beta-1,6-N-acetylglucosamine synthase-like glycosyltransferase